MTASYFGTGGGGGMAAILLLIFVFLVLGVGLFFIFREVMCWYYKINLMLKELQINNSQNSQIINLLGNINYNLEKNNANITIDDNTGQDNKG